MIRAIRIAGFLGSMAFLAALGLADRARGRS